MVEEWRPVKDWEGLYEVSNLGKVRSLDRSIRTDRGIRTYKGKELKPMPHYAGYQLVNLSYKGSRFATTIHTLVLTAFAGRRPEGYQACHNDSDPTNNVLTNLRWDTVESNVKDKLYLGSMPSGERHHRCTLSDKEIEAIHQACKMPYRGLTTDLAEKYGVTKSVISSIKHGRRHKKK